MHPLLNARNARRAATFFSEHRADQIVNALRYRWHSLRGFPSARLPYSPVRLILFVTRLCNLRCSYCQYHGPGDVSGGPGPGHMTPDTLRRILDAFPLAISAGVAGAGEPLLNPDVFDIFRVIGERHMQTTLTTNGTLLPDKVGDVLRAPIGFMSVSFYGVDGETFARRTGAPAHLFDGMVEAVAELARRRRGRRGPRLLRGSFVCTKENVDEAVAFISLCEKLGMDAAKLSNLTQYRVSDIGGPMGLHEEDPEARAVLERLRGVRHRIPVMLPRLYKRTCSSWRCESPFRELVVDSDGQTAPCCVRMPAQLRRNVFRDPHVWNAPEMVAARSVLARRTPPLPTPCLHCDKFETGP